MLGHEAMQEMIIIHDVMVEILKCSNVCGSVGFKECRKRTKVYVFPCYLNLSLRPRMERHVRSEA